MADCKREVVVEMYEVTQNGYKIDAEHYAEQVAKKKESDRIYELYNKGKKNKFKKGDL